MATFPQIAMQHGGSEKINARNNDYDFISNKVAFLTKQPIIPTSGSCKFNVVLRNNRLSKLTVSREGPNITAWDYSSLKKHEHLSKTPI